MRRIAIAMGLIVLGLTASAPALAQDTTPPPAVDPTYPPQNDSVQNPRVGFTWSAVTDPSGVTYRLEVSSASNFSSTVLSRPGLTTNSYDLAANEPLTRNSLYYWRVFAIDGASNNSVSPVRSFTVGARPVTYNLEVARDAAFAIVQLRRPGLTGNTYDIGVSEQLDLNTTYYWRVVASDPANNTRQCNSVFTLNIADRFPPTPPSPVYPAVGAELINPRVYFDWTDGNDVNGVVYRLQVATDSTFSTVVLDRNGLTASSYASAASELLVRGTNYYWRIGVTDSRNNTAFGAGWPFRIAPKISRYRLQVSTDAAFAATVLNRDGLEVTTFDTPISEQFREAVQYYWRVVATDLAGNTTSANASFRFRLNDSFAPPAPVLLYPPAGHVILNPRVSFEWADTTDSSTPVRYRVQIAADSTFSAIAVDSGAATLLATSSFVLPAGVNLTRGTRYYWRVQAIDGLGNAGWSAANAFLVSEKTVNYTYELARVNTFANVDLRKPALPALEYTLAQTEALSEGVQYFWRVVATDLAGNFTASNASFRVSLADVYAPTLPALMYPADGAVVLNPVAAFDWSDATDRGSSAGVTYRLQIASDSAFSTPVIDAGGLTTSQLQLTAAQGLARGARYWWRVQVRDAIGNTAFTPADSFTISPKTVSYRIEVARDTGFAQMHLTRSDLLLPSYDPSVTEQLTEGIRYYWRVRAVDLAGNPTTTPTFSILLADSFPPSLPSAVYPLPGAEVINPRIAFDWTDSTDPNGVSYRFQLASDSTFGAPLVDQTALVASSYSLAANQVLTRGGQYFWRVGVLDGRGNSGFTPAIPLRISAKAVNYTIEVARDTGFNVIHVVRAQLGSPEYTLIGLAEQLTEGIRYYWRVRARDQAGNDRLSSAFSLQLADAYAPTLPELIYPLADASMINPRIAFDWSDATDPNGVQYRLQISSDANFSNLVLERTGFQASSYALSMAEVLQRGQRYWWRVGVSDNNGNTAFTPGRIFNVRGKEVAYRLEIARDAAFNTLHLGRNGIDQTSLQLGVGEQLSDGVQYWWRVKATDLALNERIATAAFTLRLADQFAPPLPTPEYPVPGGIVINDRPAFEWSNVVDANGVTYRFQLASDSQFTAPIADQQALTVSQATLPPATRLTRGARYFWRIGVTDGLGNSAFTPGVSFTVQPKSVVYRIDIARDAAFTQIHSNRAGLTTNEYTLTPTEQLTEGVRYWWRVRATDLAGLDRDSTNTFTLQLADQFPPPLPVPLYPAPGERTYNPRIAFNWSDVVDPNGVFYRFQISNDSTFTNLVAQSAGDLTASQYALTATQALARGNRYYWRVVVRDSRGNSQATAPFELRVGLKEVQYRVEIGTDMAFGVLHTSRSGIETPEWTLPASEQLVEGRPYWWRVRATDLASNERISSGTFRFQLADIFAPPLPGLIYPPDGTVALNPVQGFDWSDVTDPNGVRYSIQVAGDPFFQTLVINRNQLAGSQYQAAAGEVLERGRQYWWRVGVTDTINNTAWSNPYQLRVRPKEVQYRLDVARDAAFTMIHTSRSGLSANEYQVLAAEEVAEGVQYFWRVNATDLASNQRLSSTFRFQLADAFPPTLPEPVYPPLNASVINPVVGFDWTDSQDSNGVVYRLQVAEDASFATTRVDRAGLTASRLQLLASDALPPGRWFWRVGVADSRNNGAFSQPFPFEVRRKQIEYRLEVATNAAFTAVPLTRVGLTTNEYQVVPSEELTEGTQYWWHVRARDPAGNERVSSADFRFAMADAFPPSIPTYLYPQADALLINRTVGFDWSDSRDSNGVVYTLQVSTTNDFMNLVVNQQGLTASQYAMPAAMQLARGQRYFWRVVVADNRGNSAAGPPQAFTVRNKEVAYRIDVARDPAFAQLHTWNQGLSTTEYTLAQSERLNDNVRYYWRVTATDLAGNNTGSTGFFSLQLRDIYPPEPAALLYPPAFAQVLNPRIAFDWSDVVDSAGSGVRYQLQVSTDASFATTVLDRPNLTASGYQLAAGEDLTRGQRYFWRVNVNDTLGNRANGTAIEMTVVPKVVQYRFEVASDAAFSQIHTVQSFLQTQEYTLTEIERLRENQTYYWRVTANDLSGNTRASSQAWRVRLNDIYPPDLPTRLYPAPNAAMANAAVAFDWTDSTDPNGVRYLLQVATDSSMGALVIDRNDLSSSSFALTPASALRRGQRYWWRVGTVDTLGNMARTATQSFTVQPKDVIYTLEIATDTGFQSMFLTVPDLLTPDYELDVSEEVDLGVQYYWRVRAVDVANNIRVTDPPFRFQVALPSFTRSVITPLSQPERADYQFLVTGTPSWTLDLSRRVNGQCGDLLYRRTAMAAAGMTGTWAGLSPGADYCWSIAASDTRGTVTGAGVFSIGALGTFTSTPTATPVALDVDLAASFSAASNGSAQYRDGDCTAAPTSLLFDGSDVAFAPGPVASRSAFTLEAWIRPTMANQTRALFSTLNGNVRLGLQNGLLRLTVINGQGTLTQDSAIAVPSNAWSHVAGVYANGIMRVLIDGVNRGQRVATGDVNGLPNGTADGAMLGGLANTGFIGEVASFSIYDGQISDATLGAHFSAGVAAELPSEAGRRAAWQFAEATGVQSVYDASGNHRTAVLGLDNSAEASDPIRLPSFNYMAAMGTATQTFATRLTNMTGGPTYCWRVVADTQRGLVASSPLRSFRRNTDTVPPVVVADPIFIAECQGSSSATVSAPRPMVTDNLDPMPSLVSRLNARNGVRITMPYRFLLGDTQVWWVATDNVGNEGADDTVVRVRDTTRPVVVGGPDLVVEATNPTGTTFNAQPQSATDACTSVTVTSNAPASYPLAVTSVTFTVRDTTGNETTAVRNVRVVDTTAPSFSPPLAVMTVGHDGSSCFRFAPPAPGVSDNGYPASQVEISGRKLTGPGAAGCWDTGTHTYEWTLRDPAGNVRTGVQTINVQSSTLMVTVRGLEVRGAPAQAGRYHNGSVTVVFDVAGGAGTYMLSLVPPAAAVTNTGNTFRARYDAQGAYPSVVITARDGGGSGSNYGSAVYGAFGIDTTPPVIEAEIVSQAGVTIGDQTTYPRVYFGESLPLDAISARDGAAEKAALSRARVFDGNDIIAVPHSPTLALLDTVTIEGWVRPSAPQDAAIISKAASNGTAYGLFLGMTAAGAARFEMRIDGQQRTVVGGRLTPRAWHHVAGTYDGRAMRLWVDGLPAEYRIASGRIDSGGGALTFGGALENGTPARRLEGEIAEPAIWRTALPEQDVLTHWRGGVGRQIVATANTSAVYHLVGAGQSVLDASGNANHGTLGMTAAFEPDDPAGTDLIHPQDPTASGLVSMSASLQRIDMGLSSPLISTSSAAEGTPLALGLRQVGGRTCNAPIGAVCNRGDMALKADLISAWDGGREGAYQIVVRAEDAAGNVAMRQVAFRTRSYGGALIDILAGIDALIAAGNFQASTELNDARASFEAARSYAVMPNPYLDGSFLRVEQGIEFLYDAEVLNAPVDTLPEQAGRAMLGRIGSYVESLGTGLVASDRRMHADGMTYVLDARFERHSTRALRFGQTALISRQALDSVALLYPPYQVVRQRLRRVQDRWASDLAAVGRGDMSLQTVQRDTFLRNLDSELMSASRDLLRDVLYPEMTAALANPNTTERRAMTELLDVMDKSSQQSEEAGDLVAITNRQILDACLDVLPQLQLPDDSFTRCYLRLNDSARFLDTVQEPLVATYRWRAGLGLVLFNMLELSLNASPTGLPWVTALPDDPPYTVVLPDALAATVPGSRSIRSADRPDGMLARTYERYGAARAAFDAGDINAGWSIFVDERCLLVNTFNRYYSTDNATMNLADPKEPGIDPNMVGCSQ